ncbi:MAG: transposase [Hyphomonadaceae bacterium]|nr:transposase [Hyphomonadaceae bacterium]
MRRREPKSAVKSCSDYEGHVFQAERAHGDDTTVPLFAKGKTVTARLWTSMTDHLAAPIHPGRFIISLAIAKACLRRLISPDPRIVISPVALEAVKKIVAIFDIQRELNGLAAGHRRLAREARVKPLVADLHEWMKEQRSGASSKIPLRKACIICSCHGNPLLAFSMTDAFG